MGADHAPAKHISDQEVAWFRVHHAEVVSTGRLLTRFAGQLDGALTTAQALGDSDASRFMLKYELKGGLDDDLRDFCRSDLAELTHLEAPRLIDLHVELLALARFLSECNPYNFSGKNDRTGLVTQVLRLTRGVVATFDAFVDDCTAALAGPVAGPTPPQG